MCLINSGTQREQSRVPRSTLRSRRATSWRKRELKAAVPQVTGRCRDHGMRLLLLLALPTSRGISQFSLIHLEMTIHSCNRPHAVNKLLTCQRHKTLKSAAKTKQVWPIVWTGVTVGGSRVISLWLFSRGKFGRFLNFMYGPAWQLWQVYTWCRVSALL